MESGRKWQRDGSVIGFNPGKLRIRCPICRPFFLPGPRMVMDFAYVFPHSIDDPRMLDAKHESECESFATDVWVHCPRCGYVTVHGVPMSHEEYLEARAIIVKNAEGAGYILAGEEVEVV